MSIEYLIFSDESGTWNNTQYYVRSWIKISKENYELLRKEVIFSKHELGIKELKWERFIKNEDKFKTIFSIDFSIFVTISIPSHINKKNYSILLTINEIETSTGGDKLTNKIKQKIINSTKNQLFLNYFEKIHIENSIRAFSSNDDLDKYKYIIDTPQYLDKEWDEIAKECGIKNLDITKKSESTPGIEISDVISGCINSFLDNNKNNAKYFYDTYIKNKMINMKSKDCPNPNLVFFPDFSEEEKIKMNIFR